MAKPSYQHLENPLLRGARYDLFSVFHGGGRNKAMDCYLLIYSKLLLILVLYAIMASGCLSVYSTANTLAVIAFRYT